MARAKVATRSSCVHCGEVCAESTVTDGELCFCCQGCRAVYNLLNAKNLDTYYRLETQPGRKPDSSADRDRFAYLDDPALVERLTDYAGPGRYRITLSVPRMHCASCIWLLENLYALTPAVKESRVDFPRKQLMVVADPTDLPVRQLVELVASLGYEPEIRLDTLDARPTNHTLRALYAKLALAGFSFGNVMLLSFPEYLGLSELSLPRYAWLFAYINLALGLPVLLYAAADFFRSALVGLRQRIINMDVPISLGILILFARSAYEILALQQSGYMDSFCGLVFFLLIGRLYQQKTYASLSFDRDYRAYFPVAVVRRTTDGDATVPIERLKTGDRILVRNRELIPADGVLMTGDGHIDYSFVTGESTPAATVSGDRVFAGGRQQGAAIEIEITRTPSQSYLMQLWSTDQHAVAERPTTQSLANRVSRIFTPAVLGLAVAAALVWLVLDSSRALNAATAVLIVACPCALALSTPFALGTAQRLFGFNKFYLRHPEVIEQLARVDHVVFDKTGTITHAGQHIPEFVGDQLSESARSRILSLARHSTHPLSIAISRFLSDAAVFPVTGFVEEAGQGIAGEVDGHAVRLGSATWTGLTANITGQTGSRSFVTIDERLIGFFELANAYRPELPKVVAGLRSIGRLSLLSGDTDTERQRVESLLGTAGEIRFGQLPQDKLAFISEHRASGETVAMIGDGLNDAGALRAAAVGIAISEESSAFSPACDAILDAGQFGRLPDFFGLASASVTIVKASFVLSFLYNLIGLAFAVTGTLSPVVAALLMPASSVTVVLFTTVAVSLRARQLGLVPPWK
jgi:Cu+-exporting ATPase